MKGFLPLTIAAFLIFSCSSRKEEVAPEKARSIPSSLPSEPSDSPGDSPAENEGNSGEAKETPENVNQKKISPKGTPTRWGGFDFPDTVLYDPVMDHFLVSNRGSDPWDRETPASLSVIKRSTGEVTHNWVNGADEHTTLHAPRGMGLLGNKLYVADIDHIRIFDRKTGSYRGAFEVPGARLLDGIALAPDETVYATDSGWSDEWSPATGSAIYRVDNGMVKAVVVSEDLHHPGAIVAKDGKLWVVSTAKPLLLSITTDGVISAPTEVPAFALRGLALDSDGDFLLSSPNKGVVLKGPETGPFKVVLEGKEGIQGIGMNKKRNRVAIPLQAEGYVELHSL